jgi:hypothetical protein
MYTIGSEESSHHNVACVFFKSALCVMVRCIAYLMCVYMHAFVAVTTAAAAAAALYDSHQPSDNPCRSKPHVCSESTLETSLLQWEISRKQGSSKLT